MTKNAAEIEFDNFYKLNYREQLDYWDARGAAFYCDVVELKVEKEKIDEQESESVNAKPVSYVYDEDQDELDEEETLKFYQQEFVEIQEESDNLVLSIRPNNLEERIQYNKWVIDHWREVFQKGKQKTSKIGFQPVYKSIDELVSNFKTIVQQNPNLDRQSIISNQISRTDRFIKDLKVDDDLIEKVYLEMKSWSEDDLYHNLGQATTELIEFRYIGKIWDRLKFKVFLENEAMPPSNTKNSVEGIKPIKMKYINYGQIRILFDRLLDAKFIHEETKYLDFRHVILQSQLDETPKIRWIDIADNKDVNKIPLIEFVDQLILGNTRMKNLFIKTYFNTYTVIKEQEITLEKLKQSRKQMSLQKVKSDKQTLILTILNAAGI
ncbi:hypothetical protein N180_01290 [Pedobacter antarcticus 4BY]|uniref:Uncharacterized protein n=2 Tax=Pedobacter antarcticus TaxID=34086 RepID=A0A081PC74_9SPHI|nr:hypothetical protein [Pedobacter antarcticus]KEQ28297.1 hypothetical protein N180_01290 [Pedobacter antarcticus 4BY]SFE48042.1 hypothetical protein SAMN03003324_00623 [Pedobacter antarcticus]